MYVILSLYELETQNYSPTDICPQAAMKWDEIVAAPGLISLKLSQEGMEEVENEPFLSHNHKGCNRLHGKWA